MPDITGSREWGNEVTRLARTCAEHDYDFQIALATWKRDGEPYYTPRRAA